MTRHHRQPRGRARARLVWAGVLLIVVAWGAWSALALKDARRDLLAGKADAERARSQTSSDALESGAAIGPLRRAAAEFSAGRRRLRALPFLAVRHLPVAGRQLRSADALATAGARGSSVAADALSHALADLHSTPRDGPGRVRLLRDLLSIGETTDRQLARLDLGPRTALIPLLANSRNQVATDVAKSRTLIQRGLAATTGALSMVSGHHRILLLAANNAEMRAGSGMPLQVGLLEANDGHLSLPLIDPVGLVPVKTPPPAVGPLYSIWGNFHPTHDFDELLVDPDFNQTAPAAAAMWAATGQPPVDAVMLIDPVVLQAMLAATGPVSTGAQSYAASTVVAELLHDQYVRFPSEDNNPRHEQLGALARAAFDSVNAGGFSLAKLATGLATAARGRHLMLWSATAEPQWVAAGVSGSLTSDSVLVSVINRGSNKLDWFLGVTADLRVAAGPSSTDVTVRLHLVNQTPPSGEPSYIAGSTPGFLPGDYHGIVQLNLPGPATNAGFDGVAQLELYGPDPPTSVIAVPFTIHAGRDLVLVAHFRLPGRSGRLRIEPAGRVPALKWSDAASSWTSDETRFVNW